jgi:GNAT superfamily N-acetyltransferase
MGITGKTTIARERFAPFFAEAFPLIEKHYREIAHYDDIALKVDEKFYAAADEAGLLQTFVARVDGLIAGYCIVIVRRAPHYSDSLQAVQDVIYVDPDRRSIGVGLRLLREMERELRAQGVQVIYQHEKIKHPALGKVLAHLGYEPVDKLWAKRLDRRT